MEDYGGKKNSNSHMVALVLDNIRKRGDGKAREAEGGMDEGERAAAEEAMAAMKAGDLTAFGAALKSFIKQCINSYDSEEYGE